MRRKKMAAVGAAIVMVGVLAVGLLVWPGHLLRASVSAAASVRPSAAGTASASAAATTPGEPVPAQAAAILAQLVSGSADQQRAALDPVTDAELPKGTLF